MRFALLFAITTIAISSKATVLNGNEFLAYYKNIDQVNIANFLNGYVAGQWDSLEYTNETLTDCVGPDIKMSQLVDVIGIYLQQNPQVRHFHPNAFIEYAIAQSFGCSNSIESPDQLKNQPN